MRTPKSALSVTKNSTQSRLSHFNSRNSATTSLSHSSCSSLANISIGFRNSKQCPKLFKEDQSMLFSFNPMTAKNATSKSKNQMNCSMSSGKSCGLTTAFSSMHNLEDRQSFAPFKKAKETPFRSNQHQKKSQILKTTQDEKREDRIKVFIRIKPSLGPNSNLLEKPYLYRVDEKHLEIEDRVLAYDHIFPTNATQPQVFEQVSKPILENVLNGYNGTIFAYGQTGSGKTHTIFGGSSEEEYGLIYRSIHYLFGKKSRDVSLTLSLMEIYKEELIDLLCPGKNELKLKQNGQVYVEGLTSVSIKNPHEALSYITFAEKNRRTATTLLNEKSSRSHTFLTLNILRSDGQSKLCLIDLAGSEKINKAGVSGENLEETKKINFSLSCLGNVINALVTRKKSDHIPFRDSKLTRLLKDSLNGKFMTSLVVNCSSDAGTEEESLSSLKFADRAKKIKVTISRSTGNKANLKYYQEIIKKLSEELEETKSELHKYKSIYNSHAPVAKKRESPEVTARQTIPSQRLCVDQKMRKYGKENKMLSIVSVLPKSGGLKQKNNSGIFDVSSLNVSRSVGNFFGEMGSPSISTLTRRVDDVIEDFSLNLSLQKESEREETQR